MDAAGVDAAVAVGIGWTDLDVAREANDYLAECVARSGGRLLAFGSVNPAWGDDAVAEAKRCAAAGLAGIGELHPDTQGFSIDDAAVMGPLMANGRSGWGCRVLTHASEPVGHRYPGKGTVDAGQAAAVHRGVSGADGHRGALGRRPAVLRAHAGGQGRARRHVLRHRPCRRSSTPGTCFPHATRIVGAERVLFGTDFPAHPARPAAGAGAGERAFGGGAGDDRRGGTRRGCSGWAADGDGDACPTTCGRGWTSCWWG